MPKINKCFWVICSYILKDIKYYTSKIEMRGYEKDPEQQQKQQ